MENLSLARKALSQFQGKNLILYIVFLPIFLAFFSIILKNKKLLLYNSVCYNDIICYQFQKIYSG